MSPQRTVLIIDDSAQINDVHEHQLRQDTTFSYKILTERYDSQLLTRSQSQQIDGILLELQSSPAGNLEVLKQLKAQMGDRCPPIVVIDNSDVEIVVQVFKNGAADYLIRDQMTPDDLRLAMRNAITTAELQRELQHSQKQFQISVENMLDCFGIFSSIRNEVGQIVDFRIDYLNAAACKTNQMAKAMQLGRGLCELLPGHHESGLFDEYCRVVETGEPLIKDSLIYDDTFGDQRLTRAFDIRATQLNDGFVASWRDITDRKQLELELSQTATNLQQQQHRLQRLIDTAPIGIGIGAASGEVRGINNAMLDLHGYTREEFEQQGMNWCHFIPPELAVQTEQAMTKLRQQGFLPPEQKEILRQDGTRVPVWISAIQWLDDTDEHVAFAIDLTQQKQVEAALQVSQQHYRDLAEAMPQIVWTADAMGAINYWNQRWYEYTGLNQSEPMGIAGVNMVHPDDLERTLAQWHQAIAHEEPFEIEYRIHRCNGEYHWFISRAIPTQDSQNRLTGWVGTITDIDDIKRSEQLLHQSEQQLQQQLAEIEAIYQSAPIGLGVFDADLRFVRINQRLAAMNGLPVEAHIGHTVRELLPDLVDTAEAILRSVLTTGEPLLNVEIHGETPAQPGVKRIWLEHFLPLKDGDQVIGISAVCEEISERRQAEEALHQSEDRLRIAIESARLGTWDWNLATNELRWDAGCKAMFGLPLEAESSIEVFFEGLHPEDHDRLQQVVQWSCNPASGGNYDVEYRVIGIQDGIERWIAAKGQVYFDADGNPRRFIGTVLDITEQKQAEAQREQLLQHAQAARAEAEHANQIKDEFLAVLSHELRSPLNPILGWARLLQKYPFEPDQVAEALATIERNAKLQAQLIDDLLDIARILRGKLSLNITSVDLSSVVESALETVKTAAAAKSIALHPVLQKIGQVPGDAARLQQIFWNLLSNAIKFTPEGGRIDVRLEQVESKKVDAWESSRAATASSPVDPTTQPVYFYAQVTVTDTGKGINPDFLPHIFESFRQEDVSTTRKYGGLGLGLSICRQLVEAHGGTITADSCGDGQGASFTVRLPLLHIEPEIKQIDDLPQPTLDLTGIRVLAVDDEPDARKLLTALLTQCGAEVLTVTSATEVLATLATFQPDVLISDIGMPEVDGYTLIQQVRALPLENGGLVPAIALTAYAREEDYQRTRTSGYQQHVTKPLEPKQLVQAVVALVHSK